MLAILAALLMSPSFAGNPIDDLTVRGPEVEQAQNKKSKKSHKNHQNKKSNKKQKKARADHNSPSHNKHVRAENSSPRENHHVRASEAHKAHVRAHSHKAHQRAFNHSVIRRHHRSHWTSGVFVYAPPRHGGSTRYVDHSQTLSVGLTTGSFMSSYDGGASYGDFGLGLVGRYRVVEPLGFELAVSHNFDGAGERANTTTSGSVLLYAFPWSRVSPYASLGLTSNNRSYSDTFCDGIEYTTYESSERLFGPHVGLGLEIGITQSLALTLDSKLVTFFNQTPEDPTSPVALNTNLGLSYYF